MMKIGGGDRNDWGMDSNCKRETTLCCFKREPVTLERRETSRKTVRRTIAKERAEMGKIWYKLRWHAKDRYECRKLDYGYPSQRTVSMRGLS